MPLKNTPPNELYASGVLLEENSEELGGDSKWEGSHIPKTMYMLYINLYLSDQIYWTNYISLFKVEERCNIKNPFTNLCSLIPSHIDSTDSKRTEKVSLYIILYALIFWIILTAISDKSVLLTLYLFIFSS